VEAYRTRRRKTTPNQAQSELPFDELREDAKANQTVVVAEPFVPAEEDFSFTIAIGRCAPSHEKRDARMVIDVSLPPTEGGVLQQLPVSGNVDSYNLYPVASLDERRLAGFIDAVALLFAYGGFLALFSSLGGQFTLNKLSAAVYAATFAIVYFQYFTLFTVFGGTTPGMMFRGLQVASFSGDLPTPQQMLLRSAGYMLSAGTFFLGFFWAWWDEDALTWHDRLSRTYLTSPETHAHAETPDVAHSR
jgi:uncharacterized RDD family membrane protein YckC